MGNEGFYKRDSPEFEYALFHQSTEPDIYFDEKEPEDNRTVFDARLIISTIISASKGNLHRLQAIMSLFAGLSLRESAEVCGKSHEYVRLVSKSIKDEFPELYSVLTANVRGTVKSLIPIAGVHRWCITNIDTNEILYVTNLSQFCREMDWNKYSAQGAYSRNRIYKGHRIKKVNYEQK